MHKLIVFTMLVVLPFVRGLPIDVAIAAKPGRPMRIGALTMSWGPTPHIVGLREGLVALGYRENEDFVLGVRFTQGDLNELPAAARQLVT